KSRHDTLRDWTMSASNYVVTYPNTSATHLFALFSGAAEQLHAAAKDEGKTEDRIHEVWRLCTSAWSRADAPPSEKVTTLGEVAAALPATAEAWRWLGGCASS